MTGGSISMSYHLMHRPRMGLTVVIGGYMAVRGGEAEGAQKGRKECVYNGECWYLKTSEYR
jgi:hypothetical protein